MIKRLGFLLLAFSTFQIFAQSSCEFSPASGTPTLDHDVVWFRVHVKGKSGRYKWRVPLEKSFNGRNNVALSRIGYVDLKDEGSFLVDLSILDLERSGHSQNLQLQIEKDDEIIAKCSTPAAAPRLVAAGHPADSRIISSSLTR